MSCPVFTDTECRILPIPSHGDGTIIISKHPSLHGGKITASNFGRDGHGASAMSYRLRTLTEHRGAFVVICNENNVIGTKFADYCLLSLWQGGSLCRPRFVSKPG